MKTSPLRALALIPALLALALAAGPAAGATPQLASSPAAAKSASPADALKRAQRAFAPGHSARTGAELTPLLRELAARLPQLRGAQRRQAQSLLARPTDGNADPQQNGYSVPEAALSPACSAHYCIHWVDTGDDAPSLTDSNHNGIPDYVETTDGVAENVFAVENGQLGWRAPKSDGTVGGGIDKTDIYLKQLGGTGIYGYTAPDPGQPLTRLDHSQFAYLVIDNDFQKAEFPTYTSPLTPLEVTLAHEYNHVLQFNYDSLEDTWMFESTAVWMEGKVYPAALDYLQYLPGWVTLTALPLTSFNGTDPNDRHNVKVYGSAVWNKWLDNRYGADVIRDAWADSLSTTRQSFAVAAYDKSIRAHGGPGFTDDFDRFAADTAEWQSPGSGFPEGSLYPEVARAGFLKVNATGKTAKLNHTTYALATVTGGGSAAVKLAIEAPAGTSAALALVGHTSGAPDVVLGKLAQGGVGSVTIANPARFDRLTAVLINSDATVSGADNQTGDWIYTRDKQSFFARVSTDSKRPRVARHTPRSGGRGVSLRPRVKVTFSEDALGVDANSFKLVASNGRRVSAKLTFSPGSRSATLVPKRALGHGRSYRAIVTTAVTDTAANRLARGSSWSFTTR